jgi:hypothetical protein
VAETALQDHRAVLEQVFADRRIGVDHRDAQRAE